MLRCSEDLLVFGGGGDVKETCNKAASMTVLQGVYSIMIASSGL